MKATCRPTREARRKAVNLDHSDSPVKSSELVSFSGLQEPAMTHLYLSWKSQNPIALLGISRCTDITVGPSAAALRDRLEEMGETMPSDGPARDAGIRSMLRRGGFKPSGRNRPAQEYLANVAASPQGLRSISNVVDVNNYFSLRHRLPASVIDAALAPDGLIIREGRPGETYVFNPSGQELRLVGLLCLSLPSGQPLASPVKDALGSRVNTNTKSVIACIYGSRDLLSEEAMADLSEEFTSLLADYAGGRHAASRVASAGGIRRCS